MEWLPGGSLWPRVNVCRRAAGTPTRPRLIYEVVAETYYKLDMSWLAWASPAVQLWSNAYNYCVLVQRELENWRFGVS